MRVPYDCITLKRLKGRPAHETILPWWEHATEKVHQNRQRHTKSPTILRVNHAFHRLLGDFAQRTKRNVKVPFRLHSHGGEMEANILAASSLLDALRTRFLREIQDRKREKNM
ncbi:hypothetical protein EVAR_52705_1 [Eumeta japonica]|uniref:Uncharacterized protein n=1 Tax=Eumeta variegata TaxID=151549 RepID=A0A4C1Y219_EUMVA|nr:hypothetical protein EVAR_52705_1 [Eumeta japonica]